MQNVIEFRQARSNKTQWFTISAVTIFHLLAVWALFTFSWTNLIVATVLWWMAGSLGIGLAYHRLLTHRGFKTPKWLEYFLTFCGTFALQAGPISWVTTHRIHHAFTDMDQDPHSPRQGTYWSHIGWIFRGSAQEHDKATTRRYSPDLVKDKVHLLLEKYYSVPTIILGVILFVAGGWSMVLWGIFLRVVWGWHCTWLVNSATHLWGSRRFETRDDSRNNFLIAIMTWGEGWHNNHHAYPRSARHGLNWKEIDVNWMQITLLKKLGLAKDVYAYDLNAKDGGEQMQKAA
jgi:sn-1 stearoyl-lipid 9-desaturase